MLNSFQCQWLILSLLHMHREREENKQVVKGKPRRHDKSASSASWGTRGQNRVTMLHCHIYIFTNINSIVFSTPLWRRSQLPRYVESTVEPLITHKSAITNNPYPFGKKTHKFWWYIGHHTGCGSQWWTTQELESWNSTKPNSWSDIPNFLLFVSGSYG